MLYICYIFMICRYIMNRNSWVPKIDWGILKLYYNMISVCYEFNTE